MMLVVYLAVQSVIEFIGLQGVNGIAAAGFVAQQHYVCMRMRANSSYLALNDVNNVDSRGEVSGSCEQAVVALVT